jgi:hypothetical protein
MEHLTNINKIIDAHKIHIIKSDYKSLINIIHNLNKNMLSKKIPNKILTEFFIIFITIIDNIKDHLRDIDYLSYMESLKEINTFMISKKKRWISYIDDDGDYHEYEEDDDNTECEEYDENNNEDINIINFDELLQVIDDNNNILMNFIQENNLPNDFLNSDFNVAEKAAYDYLSVNTCKCNNNIIECNTYNDGILHCKYIQKSILNNPLNLIIINMYEADHDKICHDIKKYNLFLFDGKINFLLNETDINFMKNIKYQIALLSNIDYYYDLKILQFINIIYLIFKKYNILFTNTSLRKTFYTKVFTEINNNDSAIRMIKYWAEKLDFDINIYEIIINSFYENFPELKELKMREDMTYEDETEEE